MFKKIEQSIWIWVCCKGQYLVGKNVHFLAWVEQDVLEWMWDEEDARESKAGTGTSMVSTMWTEYRMIFFCSIVVPFFHHSVPVNQSAKIPVNDATHLNRKNVGCQNENSAKWKNLFHNSFAAPFSTDGESQARRIFSVDIFHITLFQEPNLLKSWCLRDLMTLFCLS